MASKMAIKQGEQRRKKIITFIKRYIAKHGVSPTIAEIAAGVGLSSPNATRNHLFKLVEEGKITMKPRSVRAIALVEQPKAKAS